MRVAQAYLRELEFAHNSKTESMNNNSESHNIIRVQINKYEGIIRTS